MKKPPMKETKLTVAKKQYDGVSKIVLPELKKNLPSHLTYHRYEHVLNVIDATAYLITKEKIASDHKWLLLTAALLHDSGFLRSYKNHEELSCDFARETLPAYDYDEACIEKICELIMATKIPQMPLDHLAEILCDADLFYLGTDDFFPIAQTLFLELQSLGFVKTEKEWDEKQLLFLHQHHYFTKTALAELEPKKRANVEALEKKQQ